LWIAKTFDKRCIGAPRTQRLAMVTVFPWDGERACCHFAPLSCPGRREHVGIDDEVTVGPQDHDVVPQAERVS
jgi:hypothetical protein